MAGDGSEPIGIRHGLWDDAQERRAQALEREIRESGLGVVRLAFADAHGILHGKTLVADAMPAALRSGIAVTSTLLLKDPSGHTAFPVWTKGGGFGEAGLEGAADVLLLPDPTTFRVLPWAPHSGWMLCDVAFPDGRPVPISSRQVMRRQLAALAERGFGWIAGPEIEFHLFRVEDPRLRPADGGMPGAPPEVSLLNHGFQYLSDNRYDALDPILEQLRAAAIGLGLKLRTLEVEFGPSQVEMTFAPAEGLAAADDILLFRMMAKQVAARHGLHATFMCRPRIPNVVSSGWHLHQSLRDRASGANAFVPETAGAALSETGLHWLGGLLAHAAGAAVFTTPTINGYKRYRAASLAPDRVVWGRGNRGAMARVIGGAGDPATRIENRVAEAAANPYLAMAAQIASGLAGLEARRDPGAPSEAPYDADAPLLPKNLAAALQALAGDGVLRARLGEAFCGFIAALKQFELDRFHAEVTEWEQREYFRVF
jgi:glutamine synthetase